MLVYVGEVFPGDGYPTIDPAQGGTLDGLLKTLDVDRQNFPRGACQRKSNKRRYRQGISRHDRD
jgi:hypothetical protein